MRKKILSCISKALLIGGVILMMGTIGSSDIDIIDFKTMYIQAGISLVLISIGLFGLKIGGCEYVN